MRIVKGKLIKWAWDLLFFKVIKTFYLLYFELPKEIGETQLTEFSIRELREDEKKRKVKNIEDKKKTLNRIRIKNLETEFFANAGAIVSFLVTFYSLIFAVILLFKDVLANWYITFFSTKDRDKAAIECLEYLTEAFSILTLIAISMFLFLLILPYIFRSVVMRLSPVDYAKISVADMNKSEILVFLAYKNWTICNSFKSDVINSSTSVAFLNKLPSYLDSQNPYLVISENSTDVEIAQIRIELVKLRKIIRNFHSRKYKVIQQCIELVRATAENLTINKRELTNHLLKFSPAIFEEDLKIIETNLDTAIHLCQNSNELSEEISLKSYVSNFLYLYETIENERLKYLEELIFLHDIHDTLMHMSSFTSTSLSLKIFIKGISETTDYNRAKAILHRSKSHCGMDLLIPLENFLVQQGKQNAAKNLHLIKRNEEKSYGAYNTNINVFKSIRIDFTIYEKRARKLIYKKFGEAIERHTNTSNKKTYFIVFGYSDLVKYCIRKGAAILKNNVLVFVMKDNNLKALDTRVFRYELSKHKTRLKNDNSVVFNDTFTGEDHVIKNIVSRDDTVIFLGGAEVFDNGRKILYHTNKYQLRTEDLMNFYNQQGIDCKVWIVAEKYKVHNPFPDRNLLFAKEFYRDFYETLDVYDLKKFHHNNLKRNKLLLISD